VETRYLRFTEQRIEGAREVAEARRVRVVAERGFVEPVCERGEVGYVG
jgi:hypothetical protein